MIPRRDRLEGRIGHKNHGQPLTGTSRPQAVPRCSANSGRGGPYRPCNKPVKWNAEEYMYECPRHGLVVI